MQRFSSDCLQKVTLTQWGSLRWVFATRFLTQMGWGFLNNFVYYFVHEVVPAPYHVFFFTVDTPSDAVGFFLGSMMLSAGTCRSKLFRVASGLSFSSSICSDLRLHRRLLGRSLWKEADDLRIVRVAVSCEYACLLDESRMLDSEPLSLSLSLTQCWASCFTLAGLETSPTLYACPC